MDQAPLQRAVAEFVGTFALVFIGVGAIVVGAGLVGVALAHGLVNAVMGLGVGRISGGHFNPAVTLGFLITRRMEPALAGIYWAAQLAGAVVAAVALRAVYPSEADLHAGVPAVADTINGGSAVLAEAILTFFLVWVIFATAADPRGAFKSIAGLAIALTITRHPGGEPRTGAAMNPAAGSARRSCRRSGATSGSTSWAARGSAAALLYDWLSAGLAGCRRNARV